MKGNLEKANVMGVFQGQPRRYDPFFNTFNPGWKDHPNFSYAGNHYITAPNNPSRFPNPIPQQNFQPRQPNPPQTQDKSLEDLISTLTSNAI